MPYMFLIVAINILIFAGNEMTKNKTIILFISNRIEPDGAQFSESNIL
jgi:hypothetical protein